MPNKPGWKDQNKTIFSLDKNIISIQNIKDLFIKDLDKARKNEQDHCRKHKISQKFTAAVYNEVSSLLDQCKDFSEVEALAYYVFDENTIPTMEQVKQKGFAIYLAFPTNYDKFK